MQQLDVIRKKFGLDDQSSDPNLGCIKADVWNDVELTANGDGISTRLWYRPCKFCNAQVLVARQKKVREMWGQIEDML